MVHFNMDCVALILNSWGGGEWGHVEVVMDFSGPGLLQISDKVAGLRGKKNEYGKKY